MFPYVQKWYHVEYINFKRQRVKYAFISTNLYTYIVASSILAYDMVSDYTHHWYYSSSVVAPSTSMV